MCLPWFFYRCTACGSCSLSFSPLFQALCFGVPPYRRVRS
uniref:Uncharacterized protein n=1 Tax=Arundo donax TaxID=35708 RepID=A0A0A8ZH37_ARUDO